MKGSLFVHEPPVTDSPGQTGLARSLALFQAFRVEQSDPARFYSLLAADTVSQIRRHVRLVDAAIVDVGGGPGYFADAFRGAGARYAGIDLDVGEFAVGGRVPRGCFLRASGLQLPLADSCVDICMSSNVLEHVSEPEQVADEMVRVVGPGGVTWLSWTTWLSPWGGHETSPWHYLGGYRAADRYARRHGHRPKNDFGHSLYAVSAARMARWARKGERDGRFEVEDVRARYHPGWAAWVARTPVLRELASWNVVMVMRRR